MGTAGILRETGTWEAMRSLSEEDEPGTPDRRLGREETPSLRVGVGRISAQVTPKPCKILKTILFP